MSKAPLAFNSEPETPRIAQNMDQAVLNQLWDGQDEGLAYSCNFYADPTPGGPVRCRQVVTQYGTYCATSGTSTGGGYAECD